MTRIIQDSDEEGEEEILEEPEQVVTEPQDASSPHLVPEPAGTGSTESLKRAIQAAHAQEPESQSIPSALTPLETHHSFSSQAQNRDKRYKSSEDVFLTKSPVARSQKKTPLKTYGRSKSSGSAHFLSSNLDLEPPGDDSERRGWELEGTIRQDYAQHEPMAMFLELSSTVPNTSMTQQRIFEEATAAQFMPGLDTEPVAPVYEPQKSSIPWSDYLKSSTENKESLPDTETEGIQPAGSIIPENDSPNNQNHNPLLKLPTSSVDQVAHLAQPGAIESPSHWRKSPVVTNDGVNEPSLQLPATAPTLEHDVSAEASNFIPSIQNPSPLHKGMFPSSERATGANPPEEEHPRKKRRKSPAPPSDDDLAYIGLPQEQYKPRPSRSRSSKAELEEPVDYSVRPEKAARRGTRRSKISGGTDQPLPSTPEKIKQICEMGFTPATTQNALFRSGGDVSQTIEWLINNVNKEQDELAPPATSKAKGKSKNKTAKTSNKAGSATQEDSITQTSWTDMPPPGTRSENPAPEDTSLDEQTMDNSGASTSKNHKSPVKVQVVIPRSTTLSSANGLGVQAPIRKGSDENTANSNASCANIEEMLPDADETSNTNFPVPVPEPKSEPKSEPKRKRGRPKKVKEPVMQQTNITENIEFDTGQPKEDAVSVVPAAVADDKARVASPPLEEASTPGPASASPVKVIEAPAKQAETPDQKSKHAKESNTPLSNGKVSYRVGLSKRARIAPLLRVIRK